MPNSVNEVFSDTRKRSFILPSRIVAVFGDVKNAGILLTNTKKQIHINEKDFAMLDNRTGGVKAGILLDFGREISGGIRLLCAASPSGFYTNVRIGFGESASEAVTPLTEKNAGNDHAVRDFVVHVPFMSDQEWGQTGFRFAYIELEDENSFVAFTNIYAVYVRRDEKRIGSFRSSDSLIDRIFDTSAYTCELCMQNLLWDGIKRDRLVWIGDSHPEMLTIRSIFGAHPILEESLDDMVAQTPLPEWMNGMPSYSLWWLRIMRDYTFYTGNFDYVRRHTDYIKGLVDRILSLVTNEGIIGFDDYFLDWPTKDTPAARDGVQALAVWTLEGTLDLLDIISDGERHADVEKALACLRKYQPSDTDAKQAVAFMYIAGMIEKEKAAEKIRKGGAAGMSTFMSYYILSAYADCGDMNEALDMLRTYYGGMLDMGATTFWEDFDIEWMKNACPIDRLPADGEKDIHGDFGAFCYKQFRHSLCHGWSSGPVSFLFEKVLGIRFTEAGGGSIEIKPKLGNLEFAEGNYPLPDGRSIFVHAEKCGDGVKVSYTAPDDIKIIL